jgi:hypothetical protein
MACGYGSLSRQAVEARGSAGQSQVLGKDNCQLLAGKLVSAIPERFLVSWIVHARSRAPNVDFG